MLHWLDRKRPRHHDVRLGQKRPCYAPGLLSHGSQSRQALLGHCWPCLIYAAVDKSREAMSYTTGAPIRGLLSCQLSADCSSCRLSQDCPCAAPGPFGPDNYNDKRTGSARLLQALAP